MQLLLNPLPMGYRYLYSSCLTEAYPWHLSAEADAPMYLADLDELSDSKWLRRDSTSFVLRISVRRWPWLPCDPR